MLDTWTEIFMLMPVAAAVMLVVSVGFYVGYHSRQDYIDTLKDLLKSRKDDR